jgi:Flp pilus assembly protein TadB
VRLDVLCAALSAAAGALACGPPAARRRLTSLPPVVTTGGAGAGRASGRGTLVAAARWLRGPVAATVVAGVAVALVVGGWTGVAAGALVTIGAYRVLSRLEPATVRRRRQRIVADLPSTVDLLVVCLAAGRPISSSAVVVGDAVGGPLGRELHRVGARIELGGDPLSVWADLGRDVTLGPLARAVVRALDTGAPVSESLTGLAADLRSQQRAAADEIARRVAVRSAGPLGLCFLPAFVLVGVVPTIIGSFRTLMLG